jgi:AAA ATPase domain
LVLPAAYSSLSDFAIWRLVSDFRLWRGPRRNWEGVSMISRLTVQNFKNLRQLAVDLEPLTVFVGSNGSGKTSVLQAVHYAWLAATSEPQKVFVGNRHCDWLYTRGGHGDLLIDCDTDRGCFEVKNPSKNYSVIFGRGRMV